MKQLSDVIRDWEMRHGFTVDTMKRVKAGLSVKRTSSYQIARALGCTDDEAKRYADQACQTSTRAAKRTA